ncbi:MAG: DUF3800 domain-containing protein [Methylococcaceae bacterium]|jgi:hypothetical protein
MEIYLDESGDLGWKFTAPYRKGGSSRYLTIACLVVTPSKSHLPKRLIKNLYKKFKWHPGTEKKWSGMSLDERIWFAKKANELRTKHNPDIKFLSITVNKQNVKPHIRTDSNKLYNYMIGCLLLDEMSKQQRVKFIPDPRSIKVKCGNSMHDYLQTKLWFDKNAETILLTTPGDSSANKNIQFADMLSGVIQGHFEDGNSQPWHQLRNNVSYKTLFF